MSDSSSGKEVFREVDQLDESIRERVDRTGEAIEWSQPPSWSSIQYKTLGKDMIIDLPARKFNLGFLAILLPMTIFSWLFLDEFDVPLEFATPIRMGLVSLVALILAVDLVPSWRQAAWGHRVTASWRRLIVSRRTFFIPINKTIPADELEEFQALTLTSLVDRAKGIELTQRYQWVVGLLRTLGVFRGKLGVRARSDRVTCVFGSNLSDEEIQWLHDAVKYVLVTRYR